MRNITFPRKAGPLSMGKQFLATWVLCMLSGGPHAAAGEGTMSYLDNGHIRFGVDLSKGGAVTYLSESGKDVNLINSFDWGRQVQLSFYSGPVPFIPPGAKIQEAWRGLGWNPIQSGDAFRHGSKVLEHRNDGKTIYVKCVPMIWPLDDVAAECEFECQYRLDGNAVEAACKLHNHREDKTQYAGRAQELPAVYTNGPWYKLVTYLGDRPFTSSPTTVLVDRDDGKGWPWLTFTSPEHWAALLDKDDRGLGVFQPDACRYGGGFAGKPKGTGGPEDGQTGYMAPNLDEILDHDIDYTYRYSLVVGNLKEIREYAYHRAVRTGLPAWNFTSDRCHWIYEKTTDTGWPIRGELCINQGPAGSAMVSPRTIWRAESAGSVRITGAFDAGITSIQVEPEPFAEEEQKPGVAWGPDSHHKPKERIAPVTIPVTADGAFHDYTANLSGVPGYQGAMVRLRVRLPGGKGMAHIKNITLLPISATHAKP